MNILAITQARTGSSRLPNKVLKTVADKTLLEIHLDRLNKSRRIDKIIVATTWEPADAVIAELATTLGFEAYRGSEQDVLDRYYQAALPHEPDYVVRVTSDCPLVDPELVDDIIKAAVDGNMDYASNTLDRSFPDGTDVEIFKFSALRDAWQNASLQSEREHVTPYIIRNSDQRGGQTYRAISVRGPDDYSTFRLTVDYNEDFALIEELIARLGVHKTWRRYCDFLSQHPDISAINMRHSTNPTGARNER